MENNPLQNIIIELREKRWTYQEIGDTLKISRQRVHQIYKNYTPVPWNKKERDGVMVALGSKCKVCKTTRNLEIHHKNGRTNNKKKNLVLLCRKHHREKETKRQAKKITKEVKYISKTRIQKKEFFEKAVWDLKTQGKTLREIGYILGKSHNWVWLIVKKKL